jgi:hypothetical protein
MTGRRIIVFFYGLFMDMDVLADNGVTPVDPRPGYVEDFALRIGQRATLIPAQGARAYGMLVGMTRAELERLYSGPGLESYRPEAVLVRTLSGESAAALCYNLLQAPSPAERNPEYAQRLQRVLRKLDFPPDYIESIS